MAWGPERPEIRFGNKDNGYFETAGYLDVREADQRFEDAEQRRLLYVAATRAQDHLVVSLHHKPGYRSHAALLHEVCAANGDLRRRPEDDPARASPWTNRNPRRRRPPWSPPAPRPSGPPARAAVLDRVRGLRRRGARAAWATTTDPRSRRTQRVPGRGEGGTARGRAVHAVLQSVTLPGLADLEDLARLQADRGGPGASGPTRSRRSPGRPWPRRSCSGPWPRPRHWRELAVMAADRRPPGRGLHRPGLRDATTAAWWSSTTRPTPPCAPDRYRLQIGAYAAALARATGREVAEGWLVFAGVDGAEEREVGDLAAAVAEVEALVGG